MTKPKYCSLDYDLIERMTAKRAPLTPDLFNYYAGSLDDPEGYYDERGFGIECWDDETYEEDNNGYSIADSIQDENYRNAISEFYRDLEANGLENKCVIGANSNPQTEKYEPSKIEAERAASELIKKGSSHE